MADKRFATCLTCMDGRIQLPVIKWIKEHYPIDYVDLITEPGMNDYLSDIKNDIATLKEKIFISIDNHGSRQIFVVGHNDCAGNPVDDDRHKEQIVEAVERLDLWVKTFLPEEDYGPIDIVGLWVLCSGLVEVV